MTDSWLVITPPIIVLLIAFITKKLNPALITGIICAALIASDFSIFGSSKLTGGLIIQKLTNIDSFFIYSFLIMLGAVVTLIIRTGGATAFANFASKKIKNAKQAETSSLLFSFSLFIDDYLSNSTVGYVMRPLTDKFKVTRAKLAFLVHSIATPLVVLAPISGWSAMITDKLLEAGITDQLGPKAKILANPYFTYIKSIPFVFYSFLMIISVWFIVRKRISYGPMKAHEAIAAKTGNIHGGKKDTLSAADTFKTVKGTLADLFVPLFTLVCAITAGTLGTERFIKALGLQSSPSFLSLFFAGASTLLITLTFSLSRKKIKFAQIPSIIFGGFKLFYDAIIMLFLASILGSIIMENLLTGQYLAKILVGNVSLMLIPLMLFLVSAAIAIATGTSWGTIAIMIPITIPMVISLAQVNLPTTVASITLLFPAIGAVLAGSVCGDHISPVSETTIMAANSAGAQPVDHATTQFFYALPAILSACLAFLLSGFLLSYPIWINVSISFGVSLIVCLVMIKLLDTSKK
ncbi:hypothetical protein KAH94_01610 [bacterium]|nr:hypothetical protein [bacterium]